MRLLAVVVLVLSVSLGYTKPISESSVQDKVAVVTGGARGIGYAIAEEFLKNGAKVVVIVDNNKSVGEKARLTLSYKYGLDKIFFIHADVRIDVEGVSKIIRDTWGIPDILVNNAGVLNEKSTKLTIETNLVAPIEWSLNYFNCARKDHGGKGGVIINMSDIYDHIIDPFLLKFKASYNGLTSFSEALGHLFNFEKTQMKVFAISTGVTKTSMTEGQMEVDERAELFDKYARSFIWQSPKDFATALVDLLKTAKSGQSYVIEGGKHFETPKEKQYITADFVKKFE